MMVTKLAARAEYMRRYRLRQKQQQQEQQQQQQQEQQQQQPLLAAAAIVNRREKWRQQKRQRRQRRPLDHYVAVRPVRGKGRGVFSTRTIPRGSVLPAVGMVVTRTSRKRKPSCYGLESVFVLEDDYVAHLPDLILDGNPALPGLAELHPTWHFGSMINEARWVVDINVELRANPRLTPSHFRHAYVNKLPITGMFYVATRDIQAGQELLTRYGPSFKRQYTVEPRGECPPQIEDLCKEVQALIVAQHQVRFVPSAAAACVLRTLHAS
jgi:hypothetical protein